MRAGKIISLFFVLTIIIVGLFTYKSFFKNQEATTSLQPTISEVKGKVKVKYPQDFTIVLVGDSMTEYLGNSDEIRSFLKEYFPNKTFEVLNYGFGSTNILSLEQRLTQKTLYTREFRPIIEIDFDLIFIESFGHNPLSQFPLEEGLKKQTEALQKAVDIINTENPKAKIVFVATIAPSRKYYAYRSVDLSDKERAKWAEERISYIKNHIKFAQDHNLPVINIFEKSLNEDGEVNADLINQTDYIHPSPTGIIFISRQIADFIANNFSNWKAD